MLFFCNVSNQFAYITQETHMYIFVAQFARKYIEIGIPTGSCTYL